MAAILQRRQSARGRAIRQTESFTASSLNSIGPRLRRTMLAIISNTIPSWICLAPDSMTATTTVGMVMARGGLRHWLAPSRLWRPWLWRGRIWRRPWFQRKRRKPPSLAIARRMSIFRACPTATSLLLSKFPLRTSNLQSGPTELELHFLLSNAAGDVGGRLIEIVAPILEAESPSHKFMLDYRSFGA